MTAAVAPAGMLTIVGDGWEHSALFRFLREHHDAILAKAGGERMNWAALCDWFGRNGLTDCTNKAPSRGCARKTWYRVRRAMERLREAAEAKAAELAAEAEARRVEQEARREAARARVQEEEQEAAHLRQRAEEAQRAMEYRREREARPPVASMTARSFAAPPPAPVPGPDGELPPVQKGEINPRTLQPYQFGGDLPGYPSKRGYEREDDWLRDVSRMLRANHPDTNLNMTRDEKKTIMRAQSHHFIRV